MPATLPLRPSNGRRRRPPLHHATAPAPGSSRAAAASRRARSSGRRTARRAPRTQRDERAARHRSPAERRRAAAAPRTAAGSPRAASLSTSRWPPRGVDPPLRGHLPDLRPDPGVQDLHRGRAAALRRRLHAHLARTRSSCSAPTPAPRARRRPARRSSARPRARTRSCSCASAAGATPRSRSRATPWSTSPATAATRSTPPTRSAAPSLAIKTVESYLGIDVNHLVEVNFENFPQLIDSLGGITYKGGCVVSNINGGTRNGGYTLRLKAGEHEIDGEQALALARTRKNECAKREDDRTRARRQQKILGAIKDKVISFETFVRLPWVSWAAPARRALGHGRARRCSASSAPR